MSLKTLITKTVEYNNWVVNKYIDWLSTKSDDQLNQETISSFPTILKTLHHIWQTQEYWWSYIAENNDFDFAKTAAETSKEEVFINLKNNSQKLVDYVKSLSEEDLSKM
jgi:uncharacterized damage-inducible protein DinB